MILKYFYLCLFMLMSSCGSTSKFKVTSNPDKSSVFIKDIQKGKDIEIGKTPLEIDTDELEEKFKFEVTGPIVMEVRQEGYFSSRAFITDIQSADLELSFNLDSHNLLANSKSTDEIVAKLFESQKIIKLQRYDEALKILKELKDKNPTISVIHELEGGVYLLKKDYKLAYKSYVMAYKYNDQNQEALRMKKFIEEKYFK